MKSFENKTNLKIGKESSPVFAFILQNVKCWRMKLKEAKYYIYFTSVKFVIHILNFAKMSDNI